MYDVVVIGAGVIGASIAYELSRYDLRLAILEKENDVALGASRANSAIVHAGFDPVPGTLMAHYNVQGSACMEELCGRLSVRYQRNGALVLAFSPEEEKVLHRLLERGGQNGVEGLTILSGEEVRRREPQVSEAVTAALYAPTSAIVEPWDLTLALAQVAVSNGAELFLSTPVTTLRALPEEDACAVHSGDRVWNTRLVVNAAGVYADEIGRMLEEPRFTVQAKKGEYHLLDKNQGTLVSATLFRCPTQEGKGVLVTPTIHGNLLVGPTSTNTEDRRDVGTTPEGLAFVEARAREMTPAIQFGETIRDFAGLRAAVAEQDDFVIGFSPKVPCLFHAAGIKSPGLSSAPAIGAEVARRVAARLGVKMRSQAVTTRTRVRFQDLSREEKNALIRQDPTYGRIVCRCQSIPEGEILQAMKGPIPATTMDGIKRRCNTGTGRCQGGFCGPRIHKLLAETLGVPMEAILQNGPGSYLLIGETKGEQA